MGRKKNKSPLAAFSQEARDKGLTYSQYQQRETLKMVDRIRIPKGYTKVGDRRQEGR